jgi:hypothetical protein
VPLWSSLSSGDLIVIKFLIAAAAAGLLAGRALIDRRTLTRPPTEPGAGRPVRDGLSSRRWSDLALIALTILGFFAWWNLGRFHFSTFTHQHEFYHYYLGAKYSPELGYTRLYDCTAAVEAERGQTPELLERWTRDLRTNEVHAGSPAAVSPSICRQYFTDARWQEFSHDVLFFRGTVSGRKWKSMQTDHGFNATPVWTIAGKMLASTGPISRRKMVALALLDPLLIVIMWAVVWWAFGWRATAVAVLWWGTNYPARYNYIGGAFLRSDWLVLASIAIALARKGWLTAAGGALGWSTLLRIFPGFIGAGAVLKTLMSLFRPGSTTASPSEPNPFRALLKIGIGAVAAVVLLVPLSWFVIDGAASPGIDRWKSFADNSRKHLSGTATNRVSLKTVLAFDPATRLEVLRDFWLEGPGDAWQTARRQVFEARRWLYWSLILAFIVVLALAVRRQPYWVALILGVGLIPIAADITCYYYGMLLAYGLLSDRRPWIGVALLSLSALTCLVTALWPADEDRYAAISLLVVVFVFGVTAWMAWFDRPSADNLQAS